VGFVRFAANGIAQDDHAITKFDAVQRRRENADVCLPSRDHQRLNRASSQHQIQATADPGE
jgi:hypothetical protein